MFIMPRILLLLFFLVPFMASAQQLGDTITVGDKKIVLSGTNLIANSGFENGFTGWTDGTSSPLSDSYFNIVNSGGIDNSTYLVGTTNSGNTSAGAISTGWNIEPQKTYYFSYHVKYQDAGTNAGEEVWLKTSLTNDANLQEETVKLMDAAHVNSGGLWTKNEVVFTNSDAFTYLVARFRWLDNRFGFDNFTLHEAYEVRNTDGLQEVIDEANTQYNSAANRANELQNAINVATDLLSNGTVEELNQGILDLKNALFLYQVANATGTAPDVITYPYLARGSTMIFGRSTINANLQSLKEHGLCWSKHPEPTIFDNRTTQSFNNNGPMYHIENVTPSTEYYVRAYALTSENVVRYGEIIKVITLPSGTVSYTLSGNVSGENRTRIDKAMSSAVSYFNQLTSIQGHSLSVNFGSGTPTAEASYGGWMRFGPSTSYQQTGTALHELGHTIGVGTHAMWYGPSSPLRETGSGGAWLGGRTTELLQFLDNDPASYLRGDATHVWPYGVNGAHEDNGTEFLYIANALIAQALGEDGLPPTGGFATPAYTFSVIKDKKYYLKSEGQSTGLLTSFVIEDENGSLVNRVMTPEEAAANDLAAWYIEFNSSNSFYTLKNAATGSCFTFSGSGNNGVTASQQSTPTANNFFQLMESREDVTYQSLTTRGYWIIHPEQVASPPSFSATTNETTSTTNVNLSNSSTAQRWLILSVQDFEDMGVVTSLESENTHKEEGSWVFVKNKEVHVQNIPSISKIEFFAVDGKLMLAEDGVTESFNARLPEGMYVVAITSEKGQEVKRVLVQ